jgi:hypothetical protein
MRDGEIILLADHYVYKVNAVFVLQGESRSKPHITAAVFDSTGTNGTGVLRSELLTALALLRHQLRHGQFVDHHTIPVGVFSYRL